MKEHLKLILCGCPIKYSCEFFVGGKICCNVIGYTIKEYANDSFTNIEDKGFVFSS